MVIQMSSHTKLHLLSVVLLAVAATVKASWSAESPQIGEALFFMEQQAHTNLHSLVISFYSDGVVLDQNPIAFMRLTGALVLQKTCNHTCFTFFEEARNSVF